MMSTWKTRTEIPNQSARVFYIWHIRAYLNRVDRECKKHQKGEKQRRQKAFEDGLQHQLDQGNEAQAQAVTRAYANTQKGASRAIRFFPHTHPSLDQIKTKYTQRAPQGGQQGLRISLRSPTWSQNGPETS